MGVRNGVMAFDMVKVRLTGVNDVLDGIHRLFIARILEQRVKVTLAGDKR